jgi:hypothetical protein
VKYTTVDEYLNRLLWAWNEEWTQSQLTSTMKVVELTSPVMRMVLCVSSVNLPGRACDFGSRSKWIQ